MIMKVLVDTSVWSEALRRKEPSQVVDTITELIIESQTVMIGQIRQELLSGISDLVTFNNLKSKLQAFDDLAITTEDYETAASFNNTCRRQGIQGSHVDFLICAVAHNNNLLILTTDQDFIHYAKFLPIRLM